MPVADHLAFLRAEIGSCNDLVREAQRLQEARAREMIYEGVLLRAFRIHENFTERVFLSYLVGDLRDDGATVGRFVTPRDLEHARKILSPSASARFLDWSEPSSVVERCKVFLEVDSPVYAAVTGKTTELKWMKNIRNHIAHNSVESSNQYEKVLNDILLTLPRNRPSPGELLQEIPTKGPVRKREILSFFLSTVLECGEAAAGIAKT